MTTDQENKWFIGLGLNPESISDDDKKAMKQTHAFAFYRLECDWEELKGAINNQLERANIPLRFKK